MLFKNWLKQQDLTYYQAARNLAVSPETVRRWCLPPDHHLARRPRRRMLARLAELTGGAVQPDDFSIKLRHAA